MTCAMAMHFFGYEFIRNSILSLFTSQQAGFHSNTNESSNRNSTSIMTLAMACSSPFSMIVLYFAYGRMLNRYGPRKTLCLDILLSSFVFAMSSFYLHIIDFPIENEKQTFREPTSILPMMIFFLFMYQNSYVGLLQTQYWSFIGSLLSPAEGKVYFAPISGVSSITSTIAAAMVSRIVVKVGLQGLLMGGALSLIASAFLADKAYQISEEVRKF